MNWENIAGHSDLKERLIESVAENRVSHAQLFIGKDGHGALPLALAYAQEILKSEKESAGEKVQHLNHVDLHYCFPVYTEKKISLSKIFFHQFREMILQNPYSSFQDWATWLESENKQLFISADEIEEQNKDFSLKSFEGGSKILIVWRADKMNIPASNKLLKFLEEPPEKTVLLLTAESEEDLLPTILSRTQVIDVNRISDAELSDYLHLKFPETLQNIDKVVAESQGNVNTALKLMANEEPEDFEDMFVQWVRNAAQVKRKPENLRFIVLWARKVAQWNREKQKNFLDYCIQIFRLALLENYGLPEMVYQKIEVNNFRWGDFSKHISGGNVDSILSEISEASYHLERNANANIVWTDLGIKLSRYLHRTR